MKNSDWLSRPRPERVIAVVSDMIAQSWHRSEFQPPDEMNDLRSACEAGDWKVIEESTRICRTLSPQNADLPTKDCQTEYLRAWSVSYALEIIRNPQHHGLSIEVSKGDVLAVLEKDAPGLFRVIPASPRGLTDWWKKVDHELEQSRGNPSQELTKKLRDQVAVTIATRECSKHEKNV